MIRRLVTLTIAGCLVLSAAVGAVSAAQPGVLTARRSTIDFHKRTVGTENYKRTKITNTSGADVLLLVSGGLPDDFGFGLMPGSTCPALAPEPLAAGDSCYAVVRSRRRISSPGGSERYGDRDRLGPVHWHPTRGPRDTCHRGGVSVARR